MIQNLNIEEELSLDDINHLLSKCDEFSAELVDEYGTIKLSHRTTTKVNILVNGEREYEYKYNSLLLYKPTLQTFIRDIHSLGYNTKNYE